MPVMTLRKETTVPATFGANELVIVAPTGEASDYMDIYASNSTGTAFRHTLRRSEVQAMIDAAVAAGSGGSVIVDDIAARDAISAENAQTVYVVDASADATVAAGGATYIWRESTSAWIKMSEAESLDISLTWTAITGRPTSTPAQIDAAVAASHTHSNITQLNQIGQDGESNSKWNRSSGQRQPGTFLAM